MTSRRAGSKQSCKVSSTQDDFVHECTCNVALKQFRKDIKQLETNTRPCDCQHMKNSRKSTQSTSRISRTPAKARTVTSKTLPQTPSKNKTWFEVLAESPKKSGKEKNEVSGCDSSCKYASVFSNIVQPRQDEELKPSKAKQFGLLMDILYKKIYDTNDRELVNILNEINNVVLSSKLQKDIPKMEYFKSSTSQCHDNSKRTYSVDRQESQKTLLRKKLAEIEKAAEKPNREKDDIKLKALIKLLENMQSVNERTEIQQESLKHLTELINKLCKENKMLSELKDDRIALESKLASTVTENKYLKERVQLLELECKRSHRLLEAKEEEISNLKNRVGKIRETITRKIDFGVQPDLDDHSITLDLDDTVATAPSSHEHFDALIRPASSSPHSIDYPMKRKPLKRVEDDDSGIQSNAQDNEKYSKKLPTNYKNAILELKDNVKRAMEEFKLDTRLNDVSLDLSDATYKCSLSSLNLNS